MTRRSRPALFALLLAAGPAAAQPPPPTTADWDRLVVDALKEVHNRGADLYNTGQPDAGYRMYQGALLTVRPLLAHRPAAQKLIDDGFADANKQAGSVKLQAFRLHEAIEGVRAELKTAPPKVSVKPAEPAKPKAPTSATGPALEPAPEPRASRAKAAAVEDGVVITGTVKLDGKPVAGAEVMFLNAGRTDPRVFAGLTKDDGSFQFLRPVPPGDYDVAVAPRPGGTVVPAKFHSLTTSGLTAAVAKGNGKFVFNLPSK